MGDNLIAGVSQVDGTINASFMYAPFGEIIEATNAGGAVNGIAVHRRRMNDKYVDEISELGYYGFRYYDRLSMTWTQSDPLYRFVPDLQKDHPRRGQLYSFTLQNPMRYLDPDGRENRDLKNEFDQGMKQREATCRRTPEADGCGERAVPKPSDSRSHTDAEAKAIEDQLQFNPDGPGEVVGAIVMGSRRTPSSVTASPRR